MKSPLDAAARLTSALHVDLKIKRDDLLPCSGGGNKVRKLHRIIREAESAGCNAIVTHGGVQSNHARVAALIAAERGWRCRLILHGDPNLAPPRTGNLLLMYLAGAEVQIVPSDQIMPHIELALASLEREGARPFNIPGGGHCLAGTLAYADAVTEIAEQLAAECDDWIPDSIIVASGTGATQAGIIAGVRRLGWPTRVIGVSVGRSNPRGQLVVRQATEQVFEFLRLSGSIPTVHFYDNWLCGGYEKASPHILETIHEIAQTSGLILDPTYTGKAFTAMVDLIETGDIRQKERVLFWHTGGLLNLLSSPYFIA